MWCRNFTARSILTGLPTLSVPCGFSENNLPIALQIVGKPFDEVTVLRAGYTYQQQMKWYERRPAIIDLNTFKAFKPFKSFKDVSRGN